MSSGYLKTRRDAEWSIGKRLSINLKWNGSHPFSLSGESLRYRAVQIWWFLHQGGFIQGVAGWPLGFGQCQRQVENLYVHINRKD